MTDPQTIAAEIDAIDYSALKIKPEYIDPNGHMNVGYYGVIFDLALDLPWAKLGMDYSLIERAGKSSFALESHLTYQHEVKQGEPVTFTFHLLDHDEKRMHYFMTMQHATQGWLASTSEQISMCVDMKAKRGTTWPPEVIERIQALYSVHRARPRPAEAGRAVGIRRK